MTSKSYSQRYFVCVTFLDVSEEWSIKKKGNNDLLVTMAIKDANYYTSLYIVKLFSFPPSCFVYQLFSVKRLINSIQLLLLISPPIHSFHPHSFDN